jgi:hypothetical protein
VLILYYVIRGLFSTGVEQADHYIQLITFGIIAVLGGFVLVDVETAGQAGGCAGSEMKFSPEEETRGSPPRISLTSTQPFHPPLDARASRLMPIPYSSRC